MAITLIDHPFRSRDLPLFNLLPITPDTAPSPPPSKLLAHPPLQRRHVLRTSQEVLHQVIRRHRPARLQNNPAITHESIAREQVLVVEVDKEVLLTVL